MSYKIVRQCWAKLMVLSAVLQSTLEAIIRSDLVKQDHSTFLENCWMKTVTGEKAPILGKEKLQLNIGTLQVQHEMWVAEITNDCILGTDFLQPHGCLVNFRDGKLLAGDEEIPFMKSCSQSDPSCCRVLQMECVDVVQKQW